ncbi:hypothetical protein Poly41_10710 [Novipirellula artificiosorum]|uniref:Uncharacterized protein n=1 Tax=Novipirellula artificiosorum TaxID=2528016 RepID=A0A5C6E5A0_9BACT|nr:hypothetical protein Poly41_10710 [Novipirellula artificiosorum]
MFDDVLTMVASASASCVELALASVNSPMRASKERFVGSQRVFPASVVHIDPLELSSQGEPDRSSLAVAPTWAGGCRRRGKERRWPFINLQF